MKKTNILHILDYVRLFLRSLVFITVLTTYVVGKIHKSDGLFQGLEKRASFWIVLWVVLLVEMLIRFFPSRFHQIGSQKHMKKNYLPKPNNDQKPKRKYRGVVAVAAAWIIANAAFGILYITGVIDAGILVLLSLAYSVCDMICVLFFCPIRTIFMHNRCCTDCRIYNWDYAMMFTPFIFLPHLYTWTLLGTSLVLLAVWEISAICHPERFDEGCNASLGCQSCTDKPCRHKKRLCRMAKKAAKSKELLYK